MEHVPGTGLDSGASVGLQKDTRHVERLNPEPRTLSLTVAVALALIVAGPLAVAQAPGDTVRAEEDTLRVVELPPIEVDAILPGDLAYVPGSTFVVDAGALERLQPETVARAFRYSPGIHVADEDGLGRRLNIGVRGLDARRSARVLVLEDGVPIFLAPYSDPSLNYSPPIERIERIEVLKGSGQIVHGPQTVGGVVNLRTADPPTLQGGGLRLSLGNPRRFRSAGSYGGTFGRVGLLAGFTRDHGHGARAHERIEVNDLHAKAVLHLADDHRLRLKLVRHEENSVLSELGLTTAQFRENPRSFPFAHDVFVLRHHAGSVTHDIRIAPAVWIKTLAYLHRTERQSWRSLDRPGDSLRNCQEGIDPERPENFLFCGNRGLPRDYWVAGMEPRITAGHRLLGLGAQMVLGIRGQYERARRKQVNGFFVPTARDGPLLRNNELRTQAFSAFVQQRLFVGEWTVTPGVRFELFEQRNENRMLGEEAESRATFSTLLPGLGISFNGFPGTEIIGGVHRGFAPPRPADILDPAEAADLYLVDPEASTNYEFGVRRRLAAGVRVEATLFRIDFDNRIVDGALKGKGLRFVNGGATRHTGAEANAQVETAPLAGGVTKVYASANYTFTRARFSAFQLDTATRSNSVDGNDLPYAPRHLLAAVVGIEREGGWDSNLSVEYVGAQFADDLNTRKQSDDGTLGVIPRTIVLNAAARYRWPGGPLVFVTGRNLTDRTYIADRRRGIRVGSPQQIALGLNLIF